MITKWIFEFYFKIKPTEIYLNYFLDWIKKILKFNTYFSEYAVKFGLGVWYSWP